MKKLMMISMGMLALAACHFRTGRHVVISENNNLRIEYYGRAIFKTDNSGISSISDGGTVNYRRGSYRLTAENGKKGNVVYHFDLNGRETNDLNDETSQFLRSAVRDMAAHGHNDD